MTKHEYQWLVLQQNWLFLVPILLVIAAYLIFLRLPWYKRVFAIVPSLIFILIALLAAVMTPSAAPSAHEVVLTWNLIAFVFGFIAVAIVVFNLWFTKTWLHLLQVVNLPCGLLSLFVGAMAITHDWL